MKKILYQIPSIIYFFNEIFLRIKLKIKSACIGIYRRILFLILDQKDKVEKVYYRGDLVLLLGVFLLASCADNKVVDLISQKNEEDVNQAQYVLGSDDIPLFAGLELSADDSTSFDSMGGNIVVSNYVGNVKSKSVIDFYSSTLPQLGWHLSGKANNKITYKRGGDKLEIGFKQNGKYLNVRFFISSVLK